LGILLTVQAAQRLRDRSRLACRLRIAENNIFENADGVAIDSKSKKMTCIKYSF
jgi:hypothetical protein